MVDEATDYLNDNAIAYVMETLNHHNHLLHHHDQHAYCFDPQVVRGRERVLGCAPSTLLLLMQRGTGCCRATRDTATGGWTSTTGSVVCSTAPTATLR